MCGIVGIVGLNAHEPVDEERARVERGGLAPHRHLHELAAAAQVGVLVGLEPGEQGVLPRADRPLLPGRYANLERFASFISTELSVIVKTPLVMLKGLGR